MIKRRGIIINIINNTKLNVTNNSSQNFIDNSSGNINTGLNQFSYADFVLLSSTISYAIAEETSTEDLELLVTFLGMISTDLTLLLIKKRRLVSSQQSAQQAVVSDDSQDSSQEDIGFISSRNLKTKKVKKIKRRKVKKSSK